VARRFGPDELLACYRRGVFPMAESRDANALYLVDPEERCLLPLDDFHVPARLRRTIRSGRFTFDIDTAFNTVVAGCAAPAPGREGTWISPAIQGLYAALHERGVAHSVETYEAGALVGGLYGVALGGAFFGESMFSLARDASKAALVALVARLRVGGFMLLDAQFHTDHLAQFNAQTVPRRTFHALLADALTTEADFSRLPHDARGDQLLQSIAHTS
jgi:leucyl/phenylalanyl-tRNA--protein transferase